MQIVYIIVSSLFYAMIVCAAFLFMQRQLERNTGKYNAISAIFALIMIVIVQYVIIALHFETDVVVPSLLINISTTLGFIFLPSITAMWYLYVINSIYETKVPIWHRAFIISVLSINGLLSLLSLIPGVDLYFTFENGVFAQGKLYFVHISIYVIFYLATFFVPRKQLMAIARPQRLTNLFLFTLPMIGLIVQFFVGGIVLILLLANIFSFLIISMGLQHTQATTDYLTGLANRRSLSHYLHRRLSSTTNSGDFSIIMLDLDNFKEINDALGHTAGDEALRLIAHFLTNLNSGTQFLARYGGDEFIIVSDVSSGDEIKKRIEEMRTEFVAHIPERFKEFNFGFSAGFIICERKDNVTINEIFTEIDQRMFKDKRNRSGAI